LLVTAEVRLAQRAGSGRRNNAQAENGLVSSERRAFAASGKDG
jgi:hypothetical protein